MLSLGSSLADSDLSEHFSQINGKSLLTCKTVTGNLTPWSSHNATMPRFRAMRPVRMDVGVHFRRAEGLVFEWTAGVVSGTTAGTDTFAAGLAVE